MDIWINGCLTTEPFFGDFVCLMRFGLASVGKKGGKHDRDKWRGSSITENLIICTFFCKLTVNPIRTLAENWSQNISKIFIRRIAANISSLYLYFCQPHRISEECWAGSWWRVNATWDKLRISSITDIESFAYFYILGSPPPTPRCEFCHETSSCKKDMARVKLPFSILLRIQAREFFTK